jgi:hypothetical protein
LALQLPKVEETKPRKINVTHMLEGKLGDIKTKN